MPSYRGAPPSGMPVLYGDSPAQPGPGFNPNQVIRPPGGSRRNPTPSATPWGAGVTPYSATNNLIGQQIGPGESAGTQRATQSATTAQTALSNFNFTPYSQVAPANYTQAQGLLTGANNQMQGAALNYGAANGAYGQAQSTLAGARQQGQNALAGVQGMGMGAYTGGGGSNGAAARADTTALNAGMNRSDSFVGDKFGDATDTTRARALTAQALEKAMSAPDRAAIGAETLALLEARSQPGYDQSLRTVNQRNAAMGRRGSGMVTSELSDVTAQRERDLSLARRDVANEAAGRTLQDRADLTSLGMGVTSGFGGEDRAGAGVRLNQAGQLASNTNSRFAGEALNANLQDAAYGRMEQAAGRNAQGAQAWANNQRGIAGDLYGMGADEAAGFERYGGRLEGQENNRVGLIGDQATFQRGVGNDMAGLETNNYNQRSTQGERARRDEYDQFGATRDRASDLTGYRDGERDYDARNRDEMRGERQYQTGRSDKALQDEYDRMRFDDEMTNSQFDRSYRTAALGFGAPSPGTVYGNASNYYGRQAQGYGEMAGAGAEGLGYGTARRRTGAGTGTAVRP